MLAAIIKWTKKHKSWIFALSVIVVFCTAYVLIMPAQTLEQEEAEQQGGIDLPTAEQSVDAPDESVSEEPQDEEEIVSDSGDKPDSVKADLAFEGDGFSITAKAESNAKLPEDTTLTATEVTPDAEDYGAWYEKAEQALKDSPLVKDGATLKSAKFYDITLQADGKEVEPAADVNVKISYDESLKMSRSGDVYIVHFGAAANGEVEAEVLKDSSVDVNSKNSAKAGTVESEKHVDDQNDSDADDHSELKDSADYDIGDVVARDNLIRVLLLADDDFNKNKCLNYDIVISDKPNDMPNLYPIDNLDDLGENLISILNSHYLIKK